MMRPFPVTRSILTITTVSLKGIFWVPWWLWLMIVLILGPLMAALASP